MLAAKERASFPRHVSSRRGLAEIRWGESGKAQCLAFPLLFPPSAELCGGRAQPT